MSHPSSNHALVKPKDNINYVLLSQFSPIILMFLAKLSSSYLTIHNSFAISPLSQYLEKSKLLSKLLFNCCLVWLCLYCMFILCYFCAIALYKELRVLLRELKDLGLHKGKWHTYLLSTFTTALVFSVVCMIGGIFNYFTKY
jgi:hypothetical protein